MVVGGTDDNSTAVRLLGKNVKSDVRKLLLDPFHYMLYDRCLNKILQTLSNHDLLS